MRGAGVWDANFSIKSKAIPAIRFRAGRIRCDSVEAELVQHKRVEFKSESMLAWLLRIRMRVLNNRRFPQRNQIHLTPEMHRYAEKDPVAHTMPEMNLLRFARDKSNGKR